ncbi:hypothetical protein PPERSA_03067 [Pseudocohnilembus persalinus]|uniref:RING-type domain-containing protein n=1 Tax=Pseudocohnilembus persalinus TaxID=266149 RepID=A0A0V0R943_PSEPJ|nr:hypothetical protein PPERSA_03067 [Pseudocohnilembus persalinus]|eukprot:KRX11009.1 hypothetical protein PPERSA_03067 [Pseudocohnilembus persalinus]
MVAVIKDIAGVPSYETFREKILDNKKSDYYFDRDAIVSQNQKHEILLHTPLYYGNYGLTFFNLFEESQTSYFIADIKIYYQDPDEYSCKSKCFGINNYSIASGLCLHKNCICQKGYFGCKKAEQASASNSQQNSSQLSSENQYQVNNNQDGQNHQVIIYPSPIDMEPSYYNELMPVEKIEKLIEDYPKLQEISECLICYLEFEKNENVRRTLCFHVFHDECIVTWWKKNNNCPACRKILNKESVKNQNQEPMNPYISNIISHRNSVILGNSNNFNQFTSSLQLNQDPRFNLSIKLNNNNRPVSFNSQLETREANTSVNNVRANLNSLEDIKTENIFINTQLGNSQIFDESNTQARIDNEQEEQQENQQRLKPSEIQNINIKIKPQQQKNQNQYNSTTFDVFSNRQKRNSIQILQDNSDSSNQIPLKVLKYNSSSDSEDAYSESESEQQKKSEMQAKEQDIQQKFGNNIQNQDLIVSNKQVRRKRNKIKCQNLENSKNNNSMTINSQTEQNISMENQN